MHHKLTYNKQGFEGGCTMPKMKREKSAALPRCCGCLSLGCFSVVLLIAAIIFINTRPISVTVPAPARIPVNGYADFVRAGQMTEKMKHLTPSDDPSITVNHPATLQQYALAYQDALPALELMESALNKPCLCPPERTLPDSNFTQFIVIRNLARVIHDSAEYQFRIGHPEAAMKLSLDGMEMAAMTARGGGVITFLVSDACEKMDVWSMEKIIPLLTGDQLDAAEKRMQIIQQKMPEFSDIVQEEANNCTAQTIQILKSQKIMDVKHWESFVIANTQAEQSRITPKELEQGFIYLLQNKSKILKDNQEYYRQLAVELKQPFHQPLITPRPNNLLMQVSMSGSNWEEIWSKYTASRAIEDVLTTEMAVYRYKKETGRYPQSLQELVPKYMSSIPIDPFTQGKPLVYKLLAGGSKFLLYSIGPDQIDNGGQPMSKYWLNVPGDLTAGHI
jgi:hypothetical protein